MAADSKLVYAKGCNIDDTDKSQFEDAIQAAKNADVVIMTLGEAANMSGEAKSRSSIRLPGVQEELLKENERLRCENELLKKLQALIQARRNPKP